METLRRLVIRTAFPPFDAFYRVIYRAVARVAHRVLCRRGVVAVYLTRGCARDEVQPGISDIDFVVVTEDETSRDAVARAGRALSRSTAGLVEYYPNFVATRRRFEARWSSAPLWRFRMHEGRRSWRLLSGEDVLAGLPPATPDELREACYIELCRWWMVFTRLFAELRCPGDAALRNAICYKVVAELLRVGQALDSGTLADSRTAVLERARFPLAERLRGVAAGRFAHDAPGLVEQTCSWAIEFFRALWGGFASDPYLVVRPGVEQWVDAPAAELIPDAPLAEYAKSIEQRIAAWGTQELGAVRLLRSALWNEDEWLLLVDGAADSPPGAGRLSELVRAHRCWQRSRVSRVELVLRLDEVGFPLAPQIAADLHRGILTPATTPDVFLQLGTPTVYWTELTARYLDPRPGNERWPQPGAGKQGQLELIAQGAAENRIVYPLTPAALDRCRGASAVAGPFPVGQPA